MADSPVVPTTAPRQVMLRFPTVRPLVTYALLGTIVVIYAVTYYFQATNDPNAANPILDFGVLDYNLVVHYGEWYRLLTAMFLHLSPAHIFFNGLALWSVGNSVEALFGHIRFALIYFLGGLSASLASLILGRGDSAGASGAILAIIAAEMVFIYLHRDLLGERGTARLRQLGIGLLLLLGFGIISNVPGGVGIDNWAHLGGFVGGAALAWGIAPRYAVEVEAGQPRVVDRAPFIQRWPIALVGAVLLAAIALVAAAKRP